MKTKLPKKITSISEVEWSCTPSQLRRQISSNIEILEAMKEKAIMTNKKVNGYTVNDLQSAIDNYKQKYNL